MKILHKIKNILIISVIFLMSIMLIVKLVSTSLLWNAASSSSDKAYIKTLINLGGNVNTRSEGTPLLVYAVEYGNTEAVEVFLEHGADPNSLFSEKLNSYSRQTPLMMASAEGFDDIVVLLLKKGAKVDAKDSYGNDVYWYAKNKTKILKLLPPKRQSSEATPKGE